MLRHVVLFSWKDGIANDKIKEIEEAFIELPDKTGLIHDFEWGIDESPEKISHGFTHCFLVTFKSRKDRDVYLPHPAHQEFVEKIRPYMKDVLVVDFENGTVS